MRSHQAYSPSRRVISTLLSSRVGRCLSTARLLVNTEGDVQILDGGSAGALAQVVEPSRNHARAGVVVGVDKHLRQAGEAATGRPLQARRPDWEQPARPSRKVARLGTPRGLCMTRPGWARRAGWGRGGEGGDDGEDGEGARLQVVGVVEGVWAEEGSAFEKTRLRHALLPQRHDRHKRRVHPGAQACGRAGRRGQVAVAVQRDRHDHALRKGAHGRQKDGRPLQPGEVPHLGQVLVRQGESVGAPRLVRLAALVDVDERVAAARVARDGARHKPRVPRDNASLD
eukprot:scaffold117_cov99-Isochrysis_galbana.AAC.1